MLNKSFFVKLDDISKDVGMNPRDLLLVMFFESGLNPAATNKSGARGLIQFMPSTLEDMGASQNSISNFTNKSATQQLDYVKRYIEGKRSIMGGKPFTSATQYYHANFFPKTLTRWNGDDPVSNRNVVVVSSRSRDPRERSAYAANRILDTNNDGIITVGDLTNVMMKSESNPEFQRILSYQNRISGPGQVSDVAAKQSQPQDYQMQTKPTAPINKDFDYYLSKLDSFLDNILASNENKFLISINSNNDFSTKLEYAKILKLALEEELNIKSDIFSNNKDVDLECDAKDIETVKMLCVAISDAFSAATKSIGKIKIYATVSNGNSSYQEVDIKTSEINSRKFLLKFANKGRDVK